jgi:DNA polymerase III epsilon subunit-like protein
MPRPVFYDCEASALEGVPIEIGWAYVDDTTRAVVSESHLILPPPQWSIESLWDPDAQKLHGITLSQLQAQGKPVGEIAERMNQALGGRELFSDDPHDRAWLRLVFAAAGFEPAFAIRDMDARRLISRLAAESGIDADTYARARDAAAQRTPRRHRAEADARHLAMLWQIVADMVLRS